MDNSLNQFEISDKNLLKEILQRYVPYWPIFFITILLGLTGSYIYVRYTPQVFQAKGKLLVKDEKKGSDASKVLDALNIFGEKKVVENEIDILKSWTLMDQVVENLHLYVSLFEKGAVTDRELYGNSSPILIKAIKPLKIQEALGPFEIGLHPEKDSFQVNNQSLIGYGDTFAIKGHLFVATRQPLVKINLKKKIQMIVQPVNKVATALVRSLEISPTSKQSSVIEIKLDNSVPQKAEDIINQLFVEYKKAALEDKNLVAKNTLLFIEERLALVSKDLDNVEENIEQFKTREGIVNMSAESSLFLESVKDLDLRYNDLAIQLKVVEDIEKYVLREENNSFALPSLYGLSDDVLVAQITQLFEAERELNNAMKISGKKSETVLTLKDDVQKLKLGIRNVLPNIKNNLKISQNAIQANIKNNEALLKKIPQKEKALVEISRQQSIKNNIYTFLLQKREETALSYAAAVSDSRIVEAAKSNYRAISPVKRNVYLIGLGIGILIGVLYVLFKEQYNRKVLFRKEIEEITKAPILGELMQGPKGSNIVISDGKRTQLAEQFRSIRTNLTYLGLNEQNNVLLVTSSISGEGKSFVSSNLAVSIALTGKTAVLLELDLRKPKVSKAFGLSRDMGISNYLIGKASVDDIIKPIESVKGLSIISSGPIPPPTPLNCW